MEQLSIEEAVMRVVQRTLWEWEAQTINNLAGTILDILDEKNALVLRIDTDWQKAIER